MLKIKKILNIMKISYKLKSDNLLKKDITQI